MGHERSHTGTVRVHIRDGVATLTLENPQRRNALTAGMCCQLSAEVARLDGDPDVEVIAVQGTGGHFSAGVDLTSLANILYHEEDGDLFSLATESLRRSGTPTLAAVQGVCMGGGWQLASACDIVIASDTARIAITPAKIGVLYPRPGMDQLIDKVGEDRAKYLLFTATEINAAQAEAWGLVTLAVPEDDFETQIAKTTHAITKNSSFAIAAMKRYISAEGDRNADWDARWHEVPTHPDFLEGLRAFRAREQPHFPRPRS